MRRRSTLSAGHEDLLDADDDDNDELEDEDEVPPDISKIWWHQDQVLLPVAAEGHPEEEEQEAIWKPEVNEAVGFESASTVAPNAVHELPGNIASSGGHVAASTMAPNTVHELPGNIASSVGHVAAGVENALDDGMAGVLGPVLNTTLSGLETQLGALERFSASVMSKLAEVLATAEQAEEAQVPVVFQPFMEKDLNGFVAQWKAVLRWVSVLKRNVAASAKLTPAGKLKRLKLRSAKGLRKAVKKAIELRTSLRVARDIVGRMDGSSAARLRQLDHMEEALAAAAATVREFVAEFQAAMEVLRPLLGQDSDVTALNARSGVDVVGRLHGALSRSLEAAVDAFASATRRARDRLGQSGT